MNRLVSIKAVSTCLIASTMFVTMGAFAQELSLPNTRQFLDTNGVDLASGRLSLSAYDIDIGPPESRLAFTRTLYCSVCRQSCHSGGQRPDADPPLL
jgi:hypothetical protein